MNPYLLPALTLSVQAMRRIAVRIPRHRLDEQPGDARFSPREVIAHLADWEPIFRARLETARDTPGTEIEAYDEGARAIEQGYREMDLVEALDRFELERGKTVEFLQGLAPEDWDKTFLHPERGELSIRDTANMLIGHDVYHIEQLTLYLDEEPVGTW